MKQRQNTFVMPASIVLIGWTITLSAQTPQTAASPTLTGLSEESVINPSDIDSVTAANLPTGVLSAVQGGSQEIHQIANLNASQNSLTISAFLEPAGSVVPTPTANIPAATLWSYTMQVNNISVSTKANTIVVMGTLTQSSSGSPGGGIGSTLIFSTGYAPSTSTAAGTAPNSFSGVTANVVGAASVFAKAGAGSVTTTTAGTGAPVAVAGPKGMETAGPTFQLDGTQSYDPNGLALTYQWTFQPVGGQTIQIANAQTATPTISWDPTNVFAYGDYTFTLMVTNSAGLSSSDTVTVSYVPTNPNGN